MTREETKALLLRMISLYPSYKPTDMKLALESWTAVLADSDPQEVDDALTVYARTDTSGFAPSPGALLSMIATEKVGELTDGEILGMLTMASRNGSYGFEEEYRKLPALLQKAVGSPVTIRSWGVMEPNELGYTLGRIISAYKALVKRQRFELAAVGTQLEAKDRELLPFEEEG